MNVAGSGWFGFKALVGALDRLLQTGYVVNIIIICAWCAIYYSLGYIYMYMAVQ